MQHLLVCPYKHEPTPSRAQSSAVRFIRMDWASESLVSVVQTALSPSGFLTIKKDWCELKSEHWFFFLVLTRSPWAINQLICITYHRAGSFYNPREHRDVQGSSAEPSSGWGMATTEPRSSFLWKVWKQKSCKKIFFYHSNCMNFWVENLLKLTFF